MKRQPGSEQDATGPAGELHQQTARAAKWLTTNQGTPVSDNQNSLRAGPHGPTLLEDFILREKIAHFAHERIPERVVNAHGFGAHGYFHPSGSHANLTTASFLQDPAIRTPVFVRFSTLVGSQGSPDLVRDIRGFAVKFYTDEGNLDLVGANIPVFFVQDAIKFPDLIHALKPEQDRGFPQGQSAHDAFWDFVSLTPESMHALMWLMSDHALPRSYRMMKGFGVHTFRMINVNGDVSYVKFHWRPKQGLRSLSWEEACNINGADPDFHRRDLWNAIERGDYPQFDLAVQSFDQATLGAFDFDVLDATKLIPEEVVPLKVLGTMVLDRNVDEFFAETEQVAFCPSHLVPGIDFSNDPLLQGRLFAYLDAQLGRLGSPNFHEIPINSPKCPFRNLQRGGRMRMNVGRGRVANDPNGIDVESPKEAARAGFTSVPKMVSGDVQRLRAESFADHYTQARMFWCSMSDPEQSHIVDAFSFELGKLEARTIRRRMLGHLTVIHPDLAARVTRALGMPGEAESVEPKVAPRDVSTSPSLSILNEAPHGVAGLKLGVLLTDGVDMTLLSALAESAKREALAVEFVASRIEGVACSAQQPVRVTHALAAAPSVLFDVVVIAADLDRLTGFAERRLAIAWVQEAFSQLKVLGYFETARGLLEAASIDRDSPGVHLVGAGLFDDFIEAAKVYRVWQRRSQPALSAPETGHSS